jgi:hypothetical protein
VIKVKRRLIEKKETTRSLGENGYFYTTFNKQMGGVNMISRSWTRSVVLCATLLLTELATAPASAAVGYEVIGGNLPSDGQLWQVATPSPLKNWNGTLILDLDAATGISGGFNSGLFMWLVGHGYAYGGTNRDKVTYRYDISADHLVEVRQNFINHYGLTPSRTIAYGVSRGSNVARHAVELYPEIFDGGASGMGAGAGLLSTMNLRLDSQFVLKTLINPASPLKIVLIPNTSSGIATETAALQDLVTTADSTALGRARLALAAAVSQTPPWLIPDTPRPAPDDYHAQYAQLLQGYVTVQTISVQASAQEVAGSGNILWNNGVDYGVELARSGRDDFVRAMYDNKKAGLSLDNLEEDLRTLKKAPRISADPAAVDGAEKYLAYTGKIPGPFVSDNNIGDTNYPPPKEVAYDQTLAKAGNRHLHRKFWIESAGHGNINNLELLVGILTLVDRLDTGKWHYTSAKEQNALANKILSETDILLGVPRFIEFKPDQPLRTWDVSKFGTYQP